MVSPTIKEPTDTDPGDSTKWGAPDAVHCAKLLKGTHATEKIQKEAIENTAMTLADAQVVTSAKTFNDNTLYFFNPAGTFKYFHRTSAISADRTVTWPLLVADDVVVLASHSQAIINKSIDADQNTLSNIANAAIKAAAGIVYSKLSLTGSIVNADIASGAAIAYSKLNLATSIVNGDISASAAIALSKLATVTASRALVSDGSGLISASSVTSTELGLLSGVTGTLATVGGAQDLTSKGINISRVLGYTSSNISLASDALAATVTAIAVGAESGTADTMSTITGRSNGDIVRLVAQSTHVITVTHDIGGTDAIHLRHKINIILSETVPLVLRRIGGEWYEESGPEITKIALYFGKPGDTLATGDNQSVHYCDMAGKIIKVKADVDTASSSGTPTFPIRKNNTDTLSTNITIDANETSSETAATPPVIKSDGSEVVAKDDALRADCDVAGTGTKGAVVYIWIENLSSE